MNNGNTQDVIVRLLRNLGSRREVEQYVKQFSSVESQKFAIIKIGGGILRDELDALTSALTFLHHVGLFPIVIHGAGPQLNEELARQNIPTERIDGMRITDARTLEVARRVFQRENLRLVEHLEAMGTRARPIHTGVFEAETVNVDKLGLVGRVKRVHTEAINSSIRSGYLPILSCLGESPSGQILNINADTAARELALVLKPFKIIFLTPTGGLLNEKNRVIPAINLAEDYEHLMQQPWLHSGMRLKVEEIHKLLGKLPLSSSVSITSPDHLARELFTHRGSGTLIRRGEQVLTYPTLDGVNKERMKALLETCFKKRLVDNYFRSKAFLRIYTTESYRATAILTQEEGIPYLDKFAVTQRAQGEGLGGSIWQRIKRENFKLFWRARQNNEINPWYFRNAQGSYRSGDWVVFWYGLQNFDEIKLCIDRALSIPTTLYTHEEEAP